MSVEEFIKWVLENHSEHEPCENSYFEDCLNKVKELAINELKEENESLKSQINEYYEEVKTLRDSNKINRSRIKELEEKVKERDEFIKKISLFND